MSANALAEGDLNGDGRNDLVLLGDNGQEQREIERFDDGNEVLYQRYLDSAKLQSFNTPLLNFIANAATVAMLWVGGLLVIYNQLTIGELVAFYAYLLQIVGPVRQGGFLMSMASRAAASCERILEVLALVRTSSHLSLAAMLGAETSRFARSSTLVVVTSSAAEGWGRYCQALGTRGVHTTAVLVEAATARAHLFGVRQLYLVTDGAQGYFGEKLGFNVVDRKDVAAEIAATAEYALARSKNATWMRKDL
jgi:ABC-type multidrug transport system fused ATPase/permease subunit